MKIVVSGRVVSGEDQRGIFGSTVEIFDRHPSLKQRKLLQSQITNRSGEFSFRLRGKVTEPYRNTQPTFFVRAVNTRARILSESQPVEVVPGQPNLVELVADTKMLSEAVLPRQPRPEKFMPAAVFDAIDTAIQTIAEAGEIEGKRAIAQNVYCALPPIVEFEDILDAAHGVLEGRPEEMRNFQAHLDNMEIWNLRNNPGPRRQLTPTQADYLLSEEFLIDYRKKLEAASKSGSRRGMVPVEKSVILQAAAVRVAANNSMQIHRNLGILSEQFCGLRGLDRLHQAALESLSEGQAESTFFLGMLDLMGGFCEPGGRPGSFLPQPSPIPCGMPFWPPDPDNPIPFDPVIPNEWCPEIYFGINKLLEPRTRYTIDSVAPERACPGQEITIRGSNFEYEGRTGEVFFAGHPRGTKIRAVPTFYSATEVRVVVPEGAVCGDLELQITDALASTIFACEVTIPLFVGPETPFRFEGGETRITTFRLRSESRCYSSEGVVSFNWRTTCNTTSVMLTLRDPAGTVLAEFSDLPLGRPFDAILPMFSTDTFVEAELLARGPCGEDRETLRFFVRRRLPDASEICLSEDCFHNWHGNIVRRATVAAPTDLDKIVDVVHAAGRARLRIGTIGSLWSYSNCVTDGAVDRGCGGRPRRDTPDWLIKTDCSSENRVTGTANYAGCEIMNIIPYALRADARTILDGDLLSEFTPPPSSGSLPLTDVPYMLPANRFVHVKAGIKLAHLNCLLDGKCLAMATLGGSNGQSLAGAISTGTHGTNVRLPPIQDFVRAIHLVGPGGKQFWIEPVSNPITDRSRMEELKATQVLDPCLELVYNDPLFDACLVSVGAAGIIYSVVIEAAPKHHLRSITQQITYERTRSIITNEILGPTPPFFAEFVLGANDVVFYTTRQPAHPADEQDFVGNPQWFRDLITSWLVEQIVTRVIPAIPAQIGFLGLLLSNPIIALFFGDEIRAQINFLENLHRLIFAPLEILQNPHNTGAILHDALINVLNLIWGVRMPTVDGRAIIEEFQNNISRGLRPPGVRTKKSYAIYNEQTDGLTMLHNDYEKRIQSYEYIMPAHDVLPFVDRVRNLAESVRRTAPLILTINLRFTQGTHASLGMQQFERTGYVEIWTVRGINGNDEFHRRLEELTSDNVIPHWGHYHRQYAGGRAKDFSLVYPRLEEWKAAMNYLANGADGDPNTFRHGFVRERGLLPDL